MSQHLKADKLMDFINTSYDEVIRAKDQYYVSQGELKDVSGTPLSQAERDRRLIRMRKMLKRRFHRGYHAMMQGMTDVMGQLQALPAGTVLYREERYGGEFIGLPASWIAETNPDHYIHHVVDDVFFERNDRVHHDAAINAYFSILDWLQLPDEQVIEQGIQTPEMNAWRKDTWVSSYHTDKSKNGSLWHHLLARWTLSTFNPALSAFTPDTTSLALDQPMTIGGCQLRNRWLRDAVSWSDYSLVGNLDRYYIVPDRREPRGEDELIEHSYNFTVRFALKKSDLDLALMDRHGHQMDPIVRFNVLHSLLIRSDRGHLKDNPARFKVVIDHLVALQPHILALINSYGVNDRRTLWLDVMQAYKGAFDTFIEIHKERLGDTRDDEADPETHYNRHWAHDQMVDQFKVWGALLEPWLNEVVDQLKAEAGCARFDLASHLFRIESGLRYLDLHLASDSAPVRFKLPLVERFLDGNLLSELSPTDIIDHVQSRFDFESTLYVTQIDMQSFMMNSECLSVPEAGSKEAYSPCDTLARAHVHATDIMIFCIQLMNQYYAENGVKRDLKALKFASQTERLTVDASRALLCEELHIGLTGNSFIPADQKVQINTILRPFIERHFYSMMDLIGFENTNFMYDSVGTFGARLTRSAGTLNRFAGHNDQYMTNHVIINQCLNYATNSKFTVRSALKPLIQMGNPAILQEALMNLVFRYQNRPNKSNDCETYTEMVGEALDLLLTEGARWDVPINRLVSSITQPQYDEPPILIDWLGDQLRPGAQNGCDYDRVMMAIFNAHVDRYMHSHEREEGREYPMDTDNVL